jgi:hypothetical protein
MLLRFDFTIPPTSRTINSEVTYTNHAAMRAHAQTLSLTNQSIGKRKPSAPKSPASDPDNFYEEIYPQHSRSMGVQAGSLQISLVFIFRQIFSLDEKQEQQERQKCF